MRYTLRQLEVFLSIAHEKSLTQASHVLSMSQSAASSALKELEQQFDVQLFDRVGKRLQLNEQGRLIRPKAEALLAQAKDLEQSLIIHAEAGRLRVGATLSIGNYLAVGIMAKMMRNEPNSDIQLEVANTSDISNKVLNFDIDIGLIEGELQHPDLDVIPWREDELAVFCSPEHPFAQIQQATDEQLQQCDWILREAGSGTRQAFDRAMHGILPTLNVVLELQHTEAIKRAVEANLGVACLSKITLEDAFKRGNLVPISVPQRQFDRAFYFVLHKQKYRSVGIEHWMQYCRSDI